MFSSLNEEQKNAVIEDGNILLTACPGSGKTRVIAYKIAYELDRLSSSKRRIIAVTFTNRAADEIFRRIISLGVKTEQLWTGTIHAFCLEWILRRYSGYSESLKYGFSIADELANQKLLAQLKASHRVNNFKDINLRFNKNGSFDNTEPTEQELIHKYYDYQKQNKQIDFNQLLFYSYELLANHEKITKALSNIISLICIDEFQDTQDLQYAIISEIVRNSGGKTNVFYAGDVDQAIYTSLGGIAKSHKEIQTEISVPLKQMSLSGNYRTSQRIIDYYSNFQTNPIKIKAIGDNRSNKGLITLDRTIDKIDIIGELVKLIKYHLAQGVPENEICILVPQWRLITSVGKKLRSALPDVNFDASGLSPMSKHRENIWYKISRLFFAEPSPRLYAARQRWANEIIVELEELLGTKLFDSDRAERKLLRLVNGIQSSQSDGVEYLKECFKNFIENLNLVLTDGSVLKEKYNYFFENIRERISDPDYSVPCDTESFKKFYRQSDGIVINTCVGIKGEEFETVIAYGLLRGYIPHWDCIINTPSLSLASSKKLLYVICSRAKKNLHLIAEMGRLTKSGNRYVINSELGSLPFSYD